MNQEIKEQWCAALRSGEYQQCNSTLHHVKGGFCCLGVLTDLYIKEKGLDETNSGWLLDNSGQYYGFNGEENYLPVEVKEWAGLGFRSPQVKVKEDYAYLLQLNDSGRPFKEIADFIEIQL